MRNTLQLERLLVGVAGQREEGALNVEEVVGAMRRTDEVNVDQADAWREREMKTEEQVLK